MKIACIIFDLDGTLVDSESISNQAFLDLLPELNSSVETLIQQYRGQKLSRILADIEKRIGHNLPPQFETTYRGHVSDLFRNQLKPMPNVLEMLNKINLATCIASSGPLNKINLALQVSGLATYFGDRVFSSYEIGSWKPEPGIFQHAADTMGFAHSECLVIEDSNIGVEAALAAGMTVLQYRPNSDCPIYPGVSSFNDMFELPELIIHLAQS